MTKHTKHKGQRSNTQIMSIECGINMTENSTIKTVLQSQKMVADALFPNWTDMLGRDEEEIARVTDEINQDAGNENRI